MTPITLKNYFGDLLATPHVRDEHVANAKILLERVNTLLERAERDGVSLEINPLTASHISGNTSGGFRQSHSFVGASKSSHKEGRGIDIFDPHDGDLDEWCMNNPEQLTMLGLYMEHPAATKGWCHLTTRAPKSGKRVFYP